MMSHSERHSRALAEAVMVPLRAPYSCEVICHCILSIAACLWLTGCDQQGHSPTAETQSTTMLPVQSQISEAPDSSDWFQDVTSQSGLEFTHSTGRGANRLSLLETLGSGIGLFDFDDDSDLDIVLIGGGTIDSQSGATRGASMQLWLNQNGQRFDNVTKRVGLELPQSYSHGCAIGDVDRDSSPDLFLTCYGQSELYRSRDALSVQRVTEIAGLEAHAWDTAAVIVDLTGDGFPEIFVCSYVQLDTRNPETCAVPKSSQRDVCPPQHYPAQRDRLYLNLGDGTFRDVTEETGLPHDGRGLGALAADVNHDGWVDLYVANDGGPNHLLLGSAEWPLHDIGMTAGVAVNERGAAEGSMGVDFADVDGDLRGDLWVTNFELEDNSLYRNLGHGQFEHATARMGLTGASRANVGFGTGLFDFDGDNRPDIHVLNGHVTYHLRQSPFLQLPCLYRNIEGRRFEDVTRQGGTFFRQSHAARGSAIGDLDRDGALDLVISRLDQPVVILKNRQTPQNWISCRLRPLGGDAQAVGAMVSVQAFGRTTSTDIRLGISFLSHSDNVPNFALEADRMSVDVTVRWSDGFEEVFRELKPRHCHQLRQSRTAVLN